MIDLSNIKKIHCIGIGGIGLSAIADVLLSRGFEVTGSDMNRNEVVERLQNEGIKIYIGHDASNVEGVDLVVYSSAIGKDNPEFTRAKELGIPCVVRSEMLGYLMQGYDCSIAISGTHGKTTTTSMISLIIKNAKLDPTILVGGNLTELGGNVKVGKSGYFVTEACEYMDSFLDMKPKIEVILNIDSDHLDYFKDIDHIVDSFEKFRNLLPADGKLIAYDSNPFVKKIISGMDNAVTFGLTAGSKYYADNIEFDNKGKPSFDVMINRDSGPDLMGRISLNVPGEHNLLNALAAFATCDVLGIDTKTIIDTLQEYNGTQRRFDVKGTTKSGIRIVDDYAHHPTEIRATLSATKNIDHARTWVVFQPHTYTRTIALFDEFPAAFEDADVVIFAEIYAAREKNIHKISSKSLRDEMKKQYPEKEVYFFENFEGIAEFVYSNAQADDLVLTMGAGDVYKVGEMLLEKDGQSK